MLSMSARLGSLLSASPRGSNGEVAAITRPSFPRQVRQLKLPLEPQSRAVHQVPSHFCAYLLQLAAESVKTFAKVFRQPASVLSSSSASPRWSVPQPLRAARHPSLPSSPFYVSVFYAQHWSILCAPCLSRIAMFRVVLIVEAEDHAIACLCTRGR